MRRLIPPILFFALIAGLAFRAQSAPPVTPGIEENLGGTVPLNIVLNDENGKPVTLGSLIDKPTILTLNYFRCTGICTPLLNGVVEVINRTPLEPGKDYQVITVSFDERDTPEIALGKRTNYIKQIQKPFPPTAWRFLTGPAGATKALCDSVGFKFERQGDQFIHPGAIILLSPKGKITRYMYGITFLPADIQMAVQEAARGEAAPTINKFLLFCFSYDPAGHRYVFSITKVVGTAVILTAAAFIAFLLFPGRRPRAPEGEESP